MVTRVVRVLRAAAVPLALIGLTALAGVVLGRVYAGDLLTRLVIGAAVGSVLVSVAARRLPSWLVAPLSVAAMAGWTLLVAAAGRQPRRACLVACWRSPRTPLATASPGCSPR